MTQCRLDNCTGAVTRSMINVLRTARQAVEQSLILECKCHGVSGSCSVRTCWRGLGASGPSAAGSRLLRRYATAAEVRPRSGGRLPPLYHHDNLLYTTKSPDYCLPDKKRGSLGTIGRSDASSVYFYQRIASNIYRISTLRVSFVSFQGLFQSHRSRLIGNSLLGVAQVECRPPR